MRARNLKNNPLRKIFGSKQNILILWVVLVLIAKVIRYTILKQTLVDAGIGYRMLPSILSHGTNFALFENGESADATGNSAFFFDKLNIFGLQSYEQFEVVVTLLWNLIIVVMMQKCIKVFNTLQTLFIIVSILAMNIFDFTLAKEPIQILYFLAIFYVIESKNLSIKIKWFWSIAIVILSVLTFRVYYILMLIWAIGAALIFDLIVQKNITPKRLVLIGVLVFIAYVVMMLVLQRLSPSSYNELIRVRTRVSTATTDIRAIFGSGNLLLFGVNYLFVVIRLLFPIELLRFGVKFIVYFLVQLVLTTVFMKALLNVNRLNSSVKIALFLFIGFVLMSAFFEPDFGSWIRHEIAAFPLLLIISGMTRISLFTKEE